MKVKKENIETESEIEAVPKEEKVKNLVENVKEEKSKSGVKSTYKKRKEAEEKTAEEFKKSISGIASLALEIIVMRMPNPQPLLIQEKEQIDIAFSNLAEKYLPTIDRYKEETAFLFAMVTIILPRSGILEKMFSKKEKKIENKNNDNNAEQNT
jgi:hypothetical protein